VGTAALTTRGLNEQDFDMVAEFLHRGCQIAVRAQDIAMQILEAKMAQGDEVALKKKKVLLKDFVAVLQNDSEIISEIERLRAEVEAFASGFDMPGSC
jgi:glycine hydroxymethyltransferase